MKREVETEIISIDRDAPDSGIILRAVECLIRGGLVAFPTETVYGLGANAFDAAAVRKIFLAKGRPFADPLIVHLESMEDLTQVADDIPPAAEALGRRFWPGPLTLILPRKSAVPPEVSAGLDTVAARVPAHPVARALLQAAGFPIAAPSANRFGHTSPTAAAHVRHDLNGRVDLILDGGPTDWGVESTILDPLASPPVLLRPGGVSLAELEEVIGPVRTARPEERRNASPGRQARHYAPDARLILCAGTSPEEIAAAVAAAARRPRGRARNIGVLAASEVSARLDPADMLICDLGPIGDLRGISRRLFAGLRDLEAAGAQIILAHRFPSEGLGAALNDRLSRAAEE